MRPLKLITMQGMKIIAEPFSYEVCSKEIINSFKKSSKRETWSWKMENSGVKGYQKGLQKKR